MKLCVRTVTTNQSQLAKVAAVGAILYRAMPKPVFGVIFWRVGLAWRVSALPKFI